MNPNQQPPQNDPLFNRHVNEVNRQMQEAEGPNKKPKLPRFFKSESMSLLIMIIIGIGVGLILSQFVFRPYRVVGESMADTLHTGDRLIVNRLGKTMSDVFGGDYVPKRGEIIVFSSPFNGDLLVKRVIGLPGERVIVTDGEITIINQDNPNGFDPDEGSNYEENLPAERTGNIDTVVGNDEIFVSGDNRRPFGSSDSRTDLGNVPLENIIGDVVLKLLPLTEAQFY